MLIQYVNTLWADQRTNGTFKNVLNDAALYIATDESTNKLIAEIWVSHSSAEIRFTDVESHYMPLKLSNYSVNRSKEIEGELADAALSLLKARQ